ncbi:hypothetical protein [Helicobacter trogontum]|uniref:Uncharacterized protein n=1 Tax=Helicobacter trogontum TaxID=50960 RepID=A0A4U8T572_9HELI|nr:hypothetical protein [Helicobacter trogontum]MDY5184618.1 hypothetical protein [Helicobacter trogontum]TLD94665.1 hypothetical protein LS80_009915 [Helicobacter trogontum]
MEKIYCRKIYYPTITSLCFAVTLMFARILFDISYSLIYDILAVCCGFVVAVIFSSLTKLKALCVAMLLFILYFCLFNVPMNAIIITLCGFGIQVLSLHLSNTLKLLIIVLGFLTLAFVAYKSGAMRLTFFLQFVLLWHVLWFILGLVAINILRR